MVDSPHCRDDASWTCNWTAQLPITFAEFPSNPLCPGGWTLVEAVGGHDCDHALAGGCNPGCGSDICTQGWDNDDKLFDWEVTGYVDRIEEQGTLNEECAIEAIPHNNSGGTISVTVTRDQADSCNDNPGGESTNDTIQVNPAPVKTRSACHHPTVSPSGWVFATTLWGVSARRDDDKPLYLPGGSSADNSECVQFVMTGPTSTTACQATIPSGQNWWTTVAYHVAIVSQINGGNATGIGQKPGNHIGVSLESANFSRTLGHEWGHNSSLNHVAATLNVMRDPNDGGTKINTIQSGEWNELPASPSVP